MNEQTSKSEPKCLIRSLLFFLSNIIGDFFDVLYRTGFSYLVKL